MKKYLIIVYLLGIAYFILVFSSPVIGSLLGLFSLGILFQFRKVIKFFIELNKSTFMNLNIQPTDQNIHSFKFMGKGLIFLGIVFTLLIYIFLLFEHG